MVIVPKKEVKALLKPKKQVRWNQPNTKLMEYIKKNRVPMDTVAENLTSKCNPNGIHDNWLRKLIHRGLSPEDEQAVKNVVDQLVHQRKELSR